MENEQRGRTSRASSTSSLSREVRCGCQFYQSHSLLPERNVLVGRPPSRTNMMQTPPCDSKLCHSNEHEYELIAPPPLPPTVVKLVAPVVRITDTDVMPVADSDDSIDDRGRFHSGLTLDGDIVLPLDGRLEDNAMEGRELGETIDTSDEQDSAQVQSQLEDNFLKMPCPDFESRTEAEISISQVNSPMKPELLKKHSRHGFQQRLRNQAGKLRSRIRDIQRPTFTMPARHRPEKKKPATIEKSKTEKRSKMDRFKKALPERPRFSLPGPLKLSLPNRPKFNIKRPNIQLPSAFNCSHKGVSSPKEKQKLRSTESGHSFHKNIFDFSTYPRIFDRSLKNKAEYATSSPKEDRSFSVESATFPRTKKTGKPKWPLQFGGMNPPHDKFAEQDDGPHLWRHPSLEESRLAFRTQASESFEGSEKLPWDTEQKRVDYDEEIQYADYDPDSQGSPENLRVNTNDQTKSDEYLCKDLTPDRRLPGDETEDQKPEDFRYEDTMKRPERLDQSEEVNIDEKVEVLKYKTMESFENDSINDYDGSLPAADSEQFDRKMSSEERSSVLSDREQQERDFDETFPQEEDFRQDKMNVDMSISSEIHDALKMMSRNALRDEDMVCLPPQRPNRTRSLRKRKDNFLESFDLSPAKTKREQIFGYSDESLENLERTRRYSNGAHRIVYRAETTSSERSLVEHLDEIVVVPPARRKSKISISSQPQADASSLTNDQSSISNKQIPPVVPRRRKRSEVQKSGGIISVYNGSNNWNILESSLHQEHLITTPSSLIIELVNGESIMDSNDFALRSQQEISDRPPDPPKRRSRSRTASIKQDKEQRLYSADSIAEIKYIDDNILLDDSQEQLTSYAVIEKREKPLRPHPPRRRKHKYATTPKPKSPKRPQRKYSTLGTARRRRTPSDPEIVMSQGTEDVTEYIQVDSDEEQRDLRSGEILSKIQGRPLPAPPRPPRLHRGGKEASADYYEPDTSGLVKEVAASTQTDPLPDDIIIEEEITQAKLIMAPSINGSQVLISTERISTPALSQTPPTSPLPPDLQLEERIALEDRHISEEIKQSIIEDSIVRCERIEENIKQDLEDILRTAFLSSEPLRIKSLEVGDLQVDRLSVSQLEAHKIVTSQIDANVVTASDITGNVGLRESVINPSLLRELVTMMHQLKTAVQIQEMSPAKIEGSQAVASLHKIDAGLSSPVKGRDSSQEDSEKVDRLHREDIEDIEESELGIVAKERLQASSEWENLQKQVLEEEKLKVVSTLGDSSEEEEGKRDQKLGSRFGAAPLFKQTASSVKSLPPLISVTPDTTDIPSDFATSSEAPVQSATICYFEEREESPQELNQSSQDNSTFDVIESSAFQASQIPEQFSSLTSTRAQQIESEASVREILRQLLRAIQVIGIRKLRHFVNYIASRVGTEECSKVKEVELVLCALLMIIAGLLIMSFGSPRTVTHHHHWDYFNPPQ